MSHALLIGGGRVTGQGPAVDVINPATGVIVASVASASADQTDAAVEASAGAFAGWRSSAQAVRSETLRSLAMGLDANRDELARVLTIDTGRPFARNLVYVDFAAAIFRQYAELARVDAGRLVPGNDPGQFSMVARVPYGVVACLIPWNYPLDLLVFKVAPAIATGNTVVIKGAPETTLSTLALVDLFAEHTPPGVVNVLAGGRDVGERLVSHEAVDMVAFTGSTAAGRAIGETCARLVRPAHLELGGKDPAIVFDDVDPSVAAQGVAWAAFLNAGQVCTSTERAYVHRRVYDEVVERATKIASDLLVGDPFDPVTQMGPMRTEAGRRRVLAQLASAVEDGATVLTGGVAESGAGYFMRPTVVVDVDHGMDLMRDETFGPVLPIMPFDDEDEAWALAADTPYGLGASVYTQNPGRVRRAAERLQVGNLWINDPVVDNQGAPFGGMRASGNARELGVEGLHAFTDSRHVHWNVELQPKPWWYPYEE